MSDDPGYRTEQCSECQADPCLRPTCLASETCQKGQFRGSPIGGTQAAEVLKSNIMAQRGNSNGGGASALLAQLRNGFVPSVRDTFDWPGVSWCSCPSKSACISAGKCLGQYAGGELVRFKSAK